MGEMANLLMFGRELRLCDQLQRHSPLTEVKYTHGYIACVREKLGQVHAELGQMQLQTRQYD